MRERETLRGWEYMSCVGRVGAVVGVAAVGYIVIPVAFAGPQMHEERLEDRGPVARTDQYSAEVINANTGEPCNVNWRHGILERQGAFASLPDVVTDVYGYPGEDDCETGSISNFPDGLSENLDDRRFEIWQSLGRSTVNTLNESWRSGDQPQLGSVSESGGYMKIGDLHEVNRASQYINPYRLIPTADAELVELDEEAVVYFQGSPITDIDGKSLLHVGVVAAETSDTEVWDVILVPEEKVDGVSAE